MNCDRFVVSERQPNEGHVNGTGLHSFDHVGRGAVHWRQQDARIAFSIGLNKFWHARVKIDRSHKPDPDMSCFAPRSILNICLCPFHVLQNLPRLVEQQCPGLGKLDAARQTAE